MPYLQLDLDGPCSADQKEGPAAKRCETYASLMHADIRRITIAIRELGDGAIWRTIGGEMKKGARAPLRSMSMLSWPATRMTSIEVTTDTSRPFVG